MQYRIGTVSVTKDSDTVVGTGTAFLENIHAGDFFKLLTDTTIYTITQVVSNTVFKITPSYLGETYPARQYAIGRDRTPNLGLAEISAYDADKEFWLTHEVIRKIDSTPLHRITETVDGLPLWDGSPFSRAFNGGNARSEFDPLANICIDGGNARTGLF